MPRFFAHFLFLLAAWTLVIKYIFPAAYALNAGEPLLTHVMWDFWWVVHIYLGWALIYRPRHTVALAITVSVLEIVIVVAKFVQFLSAPQWDIWRTNWFINKCFVLACFILLLGYLLTNRKALKEQGAR